MRTLAYATLLALSTVAHAQMPAVCNSKTLSDERRAAICKESIKPVLAPIVKTWEPPLVCQKPHKDKLSIEEEEKFCTAPPQVPENELVFYDPRCQNDLYFSLAPQTRRQIDCRPQRVIDFPLLCQDYLKGELEMPNALRERYCPNVPEIVSHDRAPILISTRSALEHRINNEKADSYYRGRSAGYKDGCRRCS